MRHLLIALLIATAATPVVAAPRDYAAAVAAKGRSDEFTKLDASRKPAEMLDFMRLKKGMKVLDLMAGEGYYSQIMGRAVGPKGRVTAFEPTQFGDDKTAGKWDALGKLQPNVRFVSTPWEAMSFPAASYDFIMIHLNYHDLYWTSEKYHLSQIDPAQTLAMLYAATKPGGIVAVIDHVGPGGDTRALVDKLHRIDPEVIKADFKRAGFVLEAESALLRNPADDHSLLVFDPAIRGRTDRAAFRFRKPR